MNHGASDDPQRRLPNWSGINQWLLWLGLAAAVAWLVLKHSAHLFEILPFLILLACPLMHLFGHGGHGGHRGNGGESAPDRDRGNPPADRDADASTKPDRSSGAHAIETGVKP